jgi:hypothetical protein
MTNVKQAPVSRTTGMKSSVAIPIRWTLSNMPCSTVSKTAPEPINAPTVDNSSPSTSNAPALHCSLAPNNKKGYSKTTDSAAHDSRSDMHSLALSEEPHEVAPADEQNKHQLQLWAYETRNSVVPVSERLQKPGWENGKGQT